MISSSLTPTTVSGLLLTEYRRTAPRRSSHAYLDELAAFAGRGQSLVVYHHADRTAAVEEQARRRLCDLAREVPTKPVAAVRASRGSTRLFLVAATASHAGYLTDRLAALTGQSLGHRAPRVLVLT